MKFHFLVFYKMDINFKITNEKIDSVTMKKMAFFYNALDDGWTIKKIKGEQYLFTKSHEGKKQVFMDSYLTEFMKSNMDISKLTNS